MSFEQTINALATKKPNKQINKTQTKKKEQQNKQNQNKNQI